MARQARRLLAAMAAVLMMAAAAVAADSKVKGKVRDSGGNGIGEVEVVLSDKANGREYKFKTNKKGDFYQRGILPSKYTMTITKEGFTAHIVEEVVVQAGLEREFEFTLRSAEERQAELRQQRIQEGDTYLAGYDAFVGGDYELAIKNAEESIAKNPEDPRGYDMKAKALIRIRRYVEAIPLLEKELSMPGHAEDVKSVLAGAHFNAGVVDSKEEKMTEALAHWEKALELGFDDQALEGILGRGYLQVQDYKSSRTHLSSYLAKNPDAPDAAEVKEILSAIQKIEAP